MSEIEDEDEGSLNSPVCVYCYEDPEEDEGHDEDCPVLQVEELRVENTELREKLKLAVWQLENMALRAELLRQWKAAHQEICGGLLNKFYQCQFETICQWPKPAILEEK